MEGKKKQGSLNENNKDASRGGLSTKLTLASAGIGILLSIGAITWDNMTEAPKQQAIDDYMALYQERRALDNKTLVGHEQTADYSKQVQEIEARMKEKENEIRKTKLERTKNLFKGKSSDEGKRNI